jgi:hypothetical protein
MGQYLGAYLRLSESTVRTVEGNRWCPLSSVTCTTLFVPGVDRGCFRGMSLDLVLGGDSDANIVLAVGSDESAADSPDGDSGCADIDLGTGTTLNEGCARFSILGSYGRDLDVSTLGWVGGEAVVPPPRWDGEETGIPSLWGGEEASTARGGNPD